ncbi:MAG: tRNA lysidine(34) synthetase TilS [Bellilinea sp.]
MYTGFRKILTQKCLLKWNRPLVVGVSGGADSLTLLHLLTRVKIPTVAVYFNHQLRSQAESEEKTVRAMAHQWGAAFLSGRADVRQLAKSLHLPLEAAARKARYEYLFEAARTHDAQGVATGHTADDQVETILLHILRGSGLHGLRGMEYHSYLEEFSPNIPLVRPLLGFWRADIEAYCHDQNIHPLEDHTNRDTVFFRNRIRHCLIPELQTYNPHIKERLYSLSQIVADGLHILESGVEQAFDQVVIEKGEGWLGFSLSALCELQPQMVSFVLRRAAMDLQLSSENMNHAAIERCAQAIQSRRTDGTFVLGDGIELVFAQAHVYLHNKNAIIRDANLPWIAEGITIELDEPGEVVLGNGWTLRVERMARGHTLPTFGEDACLAWLDGEQVSFPLEVRGWRAGDQFSPFGLQGGSVKVADYLNQKRIPRLVRKNVALVRSAGKIAWIVGVQIGDNFRVDERTRTLLRLQAIRA